MRADRTITRPSSERVAIRPIVDRITDTRLWKHYLPLTIGNDSANRSSVWWEGKPGNAKSKLSDVMNLQ